MTSRTRNPSDLDALTLSYALSKHLPEIRERGLSLLTAYGEFHLSADHAAHVAWELERTLRRLLTRARRAERAAGGGV